MMNGITVSHDKRDSGSDNIFVKRLRRTVKYQEVHLYNYQIAQEASERFLLDEEKKINYSRF